MDQTIVRTFAAHSARAISDARGHSLLDRSAGLLASTDPSSRRRFLRHLAVAAALLTVPGAYADELVRTPRQTEGPFYPDHLPLDTDNDLLIVNDSISPAAGVVTWLSGRVLNARGEPMRNVLVEIWQCDQNGVYLHTKDDHAKRDSNFQGFGRFMTGSTGEYLFRTIKPVAYPGRTPHVHFALKMKGQEKWTTQCYVDGEESNSKDQIYKEIKDPRQRQSVTIPFLPFPNSRIGELSAKFDIVLGLTPEV